MTYNGMLRLILIFCLVGSVTFQYSFSLTESVDIFGQINSVDLVLNDIWIEPANAKNGEPITVHGSLYNAGIIPSGEVSDAITVGYIINDELLEINLIENILPGLENGVEISSGPLFGAVSGNYVITVIVNYHDTLSHLRDNPENNIVQKVFQIGNIVPSFIVSETYQQYDPKTDKQKIRVQGELTDIFQEKLGGKNIKVVIEGASEEGEISTDQEGKFSYETEIMFQKEIVNIATHLKENLTASDLNQKIFPIKMNDKQSALALEIITNQEESTFEKNSLTIVIFQDNYDRVFKEISTDNHMSESLIIDNFFLTVLPADHEYILEIYKDGRLTSAFQNYFPSNMIIKNEISIEESAQVQFKITDEHGMPQNDVIVENWIYSSISGDDGFTDWISVLPTFTEREPYVAKAIFPNGEIVWSDAFEIKDDEKKIIHIIKGDN